MLKEISAYHKKQTATDKKICEALHELIDTGLSKAEGKVWHGHPVWFIDGNPITGYSKEKRGIRLMFWSGMGFDEEQLQPGSGKFKDASIFYNAVEEINVKDLKRWIKKSKTIQWDYKNIVKNKGKLNRLN